MTPARWMTLLFAALAVSSAPYVAREGWRLQAYPDPVHGAAVPTYCAGLTGKGVKVGETFTKQECLRRTMLSRVEHIVPIMPCVREDIPISPSTETYLGNMATMSESIGTDGFGRSSMCREMRAGNYRAACDAILLYKFAGRVDCSTPGNRICSGLWSGPGGRLESHKLCLKSLPDGGGLRGRT